MNDNKSAYNSGIYDKNIVSTLPYYREYHNQIIDLVVTAVQSHHYLKPDERRQAVANCFRALKDKGVFVTFENIRMTTETSDKVALKRWENFLSDNLKDPELVKMHINRRGVEVFPITIEEHIKLLREAGFKSVDVLWTSYLQAGFWAMKE